MPMMIIGIFATEDFVTQNVYLLFFFGLQVTCIVTCRFLTQLRLWNCMGDW